MPENIKNAPLLVSKREAATTLSVSVRTIDNLIAAKQLAVRKIRRRTLIPYSALTALARAGARCDHSSTEREMGNSDGKKDG